MTDVLAPVRNILGHFHPALVHFPVAFLLGGAALETWQIVRGESASPLARTLLAMGSGTALLAAAAGLALFHPSDFTGRTLSAGYMHRILGLTATGLSAVAAGLAFGRRSAPTGRRLFMYRIMFIVTAVLIGTAAHYGGWIVFGWGQVWLP